MAKKADVVSPASTSPVRFAGNVSDQSAMDYLVAVRAAERSRIADQIHDTTCQLLAILQLNLGRIRRDSAQQRESTIEECEKLVAKIARELRAITECGT